MHRFLLDLPASDAFRAERQGTVVSVIPSETRPAIAEQSIVARGSTAVSAGASVKTAPAVVALAYRHGGDDKRDNQNNQIPLSISI